jgi:hypothetical protein
MADRVTESYHWVTSCHPMFTFSSPAGFPKNRTRRHTRVENTPCCVRCTPVPDIVSTILAKALVMLLEAILARLILQFMRSGLYRDLRAAGAA